MLSTERTGSPANKSTRQTTHAARNTAPTYVVDYTPAVVKRAFLPLHGVSTPIDEILAVTDAVFTFLTISDLDRETKNAFFVLQQQYDFYKNLLKS